MAQLPTRMCLFAADGGQLYYIRRRVEPGCGKDREDRVDNFFFHAFDTFHIGSTLKSSEA